MRNASQYDLLIIGGGPAGVTAALRGRELGAAIAVIDRGPLGGACTNDGCVPTRFLAHAARLIRNASEYSEYGLAGSPPTVDIGAVMDRAREMVAKIHAKKRLKEQLLDAGADIYDETETASFIGPHTVTFGEGRSLTARRILLCAGGHARRLSVPGGHLAITHSDVWNLRVLPERLLVIGGAATGCQIASVFRAFGSNVTLLDTAERLTPSEDADISGEVTRGFIARGMTVRLGVTVSQLSESAEGAKRVSLSNGTLTSEHDYDLVIAAVGWPGNIDQLNLVAAGVKTARGYVTVDDALRTSAAHIYAAGDITGRMMLVQCAGEEGLAAAENALRADSFHERPHQVVPHGGFTDPEYGSVGLTEPEARSKSDVVTAAIPYSHIDRAVIDGRPEGFCKLIVDRNTRRIVGAHVVGQQAVEIVQVAATAMQSRADIDDIARLEYAYPTFTSAIGLAARRILRKLGESSTVRHWGSADSALAPEWEGIEV